MKHISVKDVLESLKKEYPDFVEIIYDDEAYAFKVIVGGVSKVIAEVTPVGLVVQEPLSFDGVELIVTFFRGLLNE